MTNKFLVLLIILLIVFKFAAIYFTNFGLYGDEAQYWLWSLKPDLGYYSKPPLLAWFIYGYANIFGDSFFSLKTFPIVVYFFIFFSIYKLCISLLLSKHNSLLCAISFIIIPAASVSSFLISTDLLLLLFWTLSLVILLSIIKNNYIHNFFLLGLFLGLAFLAKYAAIYFLLCLLILIIIDKKILSIFKNNLLGSFVFLITFLLVLGPNILWNINNGWVTLSHTSDNINLQNLNLNFIEPLRFLVAQILMVGPFLFFSFMFFLKYFYLDFENKFLLVFSVPIFFVVLIESFLVRANANWAAPALISLFVLLFRLVNFNKPKLIKINFLFNYVVVLFLFASILFTSNSKVFDRIRGVDDFAKEVLDISNGMDLVISDRIVFSNISYKMRDKENIIFMPYKINSPIKNHFQISSPLSGDHGDDFFLIGELNDVSYLSKKYQKNLIKQFNVTFSSSQLSLYEISFK